MEHFHYPVHYESENENGRQLLEVQQGDRQNEGVAGSGTDAPAGRIRNAHLAMLASGTQLPLSSGQLFTGMGRAFNERHGVEGRANSVDSSDNGYFKMESSFLGCSQIIGLSPTTTTKSYPSGKRIVATRYFMNTHRPKVIADQKTAIVYEAIAQTDGQLQPTVRRFN